MDFTRLAAAGFDYIALGHSHKPHTVCRDKIVYAGALEPQNRNDVGKHGYIEGEFDGETVKLKLRPFALRSYQNLVLAEYHTVCIGRYASEGSYEAGRKKYISSDH